MGRSSTVIGKCAACETAIFDDHPYAWCDRCGAPLPEKVQAALPALRQPPPPSDRGVPLVVRNREVPCPICQHNRFFISKKVVPGRAAVLLNAAWASATADTYVCAACGHMLWFMPP